MKLKLIGTGLFTRAYRKGNSNVVLIKSECYVKECLSFKWHRNHSGIFPTIDRTAINEYEMNFYPKVKSLKKSLRPDQWEIYKELCTVFKDRLPYNKNYRDRGCRYTALIEEITKANLPVKVKNDIVSVVESIGNWGSDIGFEISPRNVAVDNGRLIMLDCFFMVSQARQKREY